MAAAYEVGSRVKIEINDLPYAGTIITYNDAVDPITYKVSVDGYGNVVTAEESNLEALA